MEPTAVDSEVAHLFRHRAGDMVASLTRILGWEHLDLVEDAVQDAFVTALRQWPFGERPRNPSGWLMRVAKNRALDGLRRGQRWQQKRQELEADLERLSAVRPGDPREGWFANELRDAQLSMVFACCDPYLPAEQQIALTLKMVGGFSVGEIARAFLSSKSTIAQRLVRAKRRLRARSGRPCMPSPAQLPGRLSVVLEALYLLFNEGYDASKGDSVVRQDLCGEAMRLCELLSVHGPTATPEVHALASLFCFQAARLQTRCDGAGDLILIAEQDRSLWDRGLIERGARHLRDSARGDAISAYHLQAEIASLHALAASYDQTDWRRILRCYDDLVRVQPSPVTRLNRLIALAQARNVQAALTELRASSLPDELGDYYPLHATRGMLLRAIGRGGDAAQSYERAEKLATSEPVKRFLAQQAAHCRGQNS